MMATLGRSDAALETTGKGQTRAAAIVITIPAGRTEIATIENAIARSRMRSADMFTCRADQSASWVTTAREYTLRGTESRTVAIVGTFRARRIPGLVTCETCANKG